MVLRILVIDDDRERLGALEFGLKALGYLVIAELCGGNSANSLTEPQSDYRGVINSIKEPFTLNRLARLINAVLKRD